MYGKSFLTMLEARVEGGSLRCRFENGDEVLLEVSRAVPKGSSAPRWDEAQLDPGGWTITVPASPYPFSVPSDVIRLLTHEGFAAHVAAREGLCAHRLRERTGVVRYSAPLQVEWRCLGCGERWWEEEGEGIRVCAGAPDCPTCSDS